MLELLSFPEISTTIFEANRPMGRSNPLILLFIVECGGNGQPRAPGLLVMLSFSLQEREAKSFSYYKKLRPVGSAYFSPVIDNNLRERAVTFRQHFDATPAVLE